MAVKKIFTVLVLGLAFSVVVFFARRSLVKSVNEQTGKIIVIGSKNFTESVILAHMIADVIEDQMDIRVVRKVNLGGSSLCRQALLTNDIQMYPEYVSTIVLNHYNLKPQKSKNALEQVQALLERDGLEFITKFGVNNGYSLAVSKATANKYNLKCISDLSEIAPKLKCGSDFEFMDRPDGYPAFMNTYDLKFKSVKGMDHGIVYRAMLDNKLDVVVGFTTDSQLHINNVMILKDDKEFSGCYDAGILIRTDVFEKYPKLRQCLAKLEAIVTDEEMREINALVDSEGLKAKVVANEFLKKKGVLSGD
jgi:osmoprotectant transport system substrate-binding protein